jgi:hypothetical protein
MFNCLIHMNSYVLACNMSEIQENQLQMLNIPITMHIIKFIPYHVYVNMHSVDNDSQ